MRGVLCDEASPLSRKVFLGEDRLNGAFIDTQAAIDTGIGVDEKLVGFCKVRFILGGMDAIDRTYRNAGGVFHSYARLGNDVGHIDNRRFERRRRNEIPVDLKRIMGVTVYRRAAF
jgi:hypothetical protein